MRNDYNILSKDGFKPQKIPFKRLRRILLEVLQVLLHEELTLKLTAPFLSTIRSS